MMWQKEMKILDRASSQKSSCWCVLGKEWGNKHRNVLLYSKEKKQSVPLTAGTTWLLIAVFSKKVSSVTPLSDLVSSSAKSKILFCPTVSSHS